MMNLFPNSSNIPSLGKQMNVEEIKEPFVKLTTIFYQRYLKQIYPQINVVDIKKPLTFPNEPVHNNYKDKSQSDQQHP